MIPSIRTFAAACIAAWLVASCPAPSPAASVLGITFFDHELISVDTTTGDGTLVGPIGSTISPFGLAYRGNQLLTFDATSDVVRQLNPASGATTATYNIGLATGSVLGQGGLAFRGDGLGFFTSALDPATFATVNNLYRFDIAAGTSTLVGHTTATLEALAFGPNGVLYGLGKLDGNLYSINPTTAATTLVGNTGVAVGSPTGGLAFAPNGTLYATLDDAIYTLNPANGVAARVNPDPTADTGFSTISGLAFAPSAVPEPSSWVLLATAIGVIGLVGSRGRGT